MKNFALAFPLVFAINLLFTQSGVGANKKVFQVCPSAQRFKLSDCEHNSHLSKAAARCWQEFDQRARLASQNLKKALDETNEKSKSSAQSQRFHQTGEDYSKTTLAVAGLALEAAAAAVTVDSYLDAVIFPEDFDEEEIVQDHGGPEAFLGTSRCYTENSRYIEKVKEKFLQSQQELEKLAALSGSLENTSGTRKSNTAALKSAEDISGSTSNAPQTKVKVHNSTISGTEKIKKKSP